MPTSRQTSLRDELLKRAKLGEISPKKAEQEAALSECGPLAIDPYSLELDPLREPTWTLLMALVWIVTRDPAAVRAVWVEARAASSVG